MGPGEENIIFSLHYRIMLRKIYKILMSMLNVEFVCKLLK